MRRLFQPVIASVLVILLGSCAVSDTSVATTTASQLPTSKPMPTLTPSPTTEPTSNPIHRLSPGTPVRISSIRMFNEIQGWGIGGEKDHVLRTQDGGNSWIDVTPLEPELGSLESKRFMIGFFLDFNHAWFRYSDSTKVWRTEDGGQNWNFTELVDVPFFYPSEIFPETLFFVDPQNGWLILYLESGMSHQYVNFYRTIDGGVTWEKLIDPMGPGQLQSCCKTGMVFQDPQVGLITYEQGPYSEPHISWTQDSGRTWEFQALPSPFEDPNLAMNSYCTAHSPSIFSPETAILGIECLTTEDPTETFSFLYVTGDTGQNWEIMPYHGGSLLFSSQSIGFSFGPDLYKTEDGGQTWEFVNSFDWEGQISFIDFLQGWAVAEVLSDILLLHTADGGQTWIQKEPLVID